MTGESYNVIPVGKTVVRGVPPAQIEKALTESAKAGMLVTCDSNDYLIKKAAASTHPVGWICYEKTDYKVRPENIDGTFVSGDVVMVVSGGNFELQAYATGQASTGSDVTITIGDYLASNNDGTLTLWSPDGTVASTTATNPYPPVAIAMETVAIPASSGATGDVVKIHVKSLI